ncbi:hypothetical protein QVD17_19878 [Tagetes erecta]|uniref:Uncharacterized protein n=1 Tax=Tagetes erecta TaxID=13708 RepID=A0AAD8NXP7_TARER|nr:hypothetical protein QVD17_19878 [Tagetes erecta]
MECGGEEHTENIQEETNVIDMPDTDVADAESSQDEEAGSKDVSNPMASIEDRAGALLNIFEAKIETELKKKTSPGEEHTENIQEETNVIDMPDTDVADAESSQDEEAGSKDVSNPMASIEDRAGALLNIFEAKIETELKKKTSPGEVTRGSLENSNEALVTAEIDG